MSDLVKRLPDCMMPDGADPCRGFQDLMDEIERLREALRLAKDDALRLVDEIDRELDEIERLQACRHAHSHRCWSGGNYHEGFEEGFKAGQKAVIKNMRAWAGSRDKIMIGSVDNLLDAYTKDRGIE